MRYVVGWGRDDTQHSGQPEVVVAGADELDAVLDRIQRAGIPQMVDISPADDDHDVPYGLQIGVGTTDHSFALYIGQPTGGVGYDPSLPPAPRQHPLRLRWRAHRLPTGPPAADPRRGAASGPGVRHHRQRPTNISWTC